ncbi:MAG: hypothetical protein ABSG63_00955 [Spirochaetia bacterium]|jgi:hypothetical protein
MQSFSVRWLRLFGPVILFALLAMSCSVNQTIMIKSDGSGTLAMRADVSKLLRDYIGSLSEVSGKPAPAAGANLFDAAAIRKDFETRKGLTVKKAVTPTPTSFDLELSYTSIRDIFASDATLKNAGVMTWSEEAGKKTLKLHLDRTNYTQLSALFPMLKDPAIAGLGPQVNDTITDAEYLDMIKFSLGDDGPGLLKKSFITLTIDPEGEIISQSGGTVNGGTVVFRIPLIRLLVLDKPLDYSVSFK